MASTNPLMKKLAEGSAAEEATETPAFEKKEDAKVVVKKPTAKVTKRVSAGQAQKLAAMLKGKK